MKPKSNRVMSHSKKDQRLSPVQIQILRLAAEGMSNYQIGRRLFLTAGTVGGHFTSVSRKLGSKNRVHSVVLAIRAGLL